MRRGDIRRYKHKGGVPTTTLATTRRHEYHKEAREEEERRRGKQEIRSVGVVEDRTQPVEEVRTATPSSSPKRTKKRENRVSGNGRTYVNVVGREKHSPINYTSNQSHLRGMDVFKIAKLNINGLASRTKVEIL